MEIRIKEKTDYLKRLVGAYIKYFSKTYNSSDVLVGRKYITIKLWRHDGKKKSDIDDTSEFPIKLLSRTIRTYEGKIKTAFHNRNKK
jgi:hypothetical protein